MILCTLISFLIALLSGVAIFASGGSRNRALDVLFAFSVTFFLGSLVTLLTHRVAKHFRETHHDGDKT